jgi:L-aminopeptidase/D-esterase-like protein
LAGTNTTIGVIATDAKLSKTQAQRLAQIVFAHILARKSGDTQ